MKRITSDVDLELSILEEVLQEEFIIELLQDVEGEMSGKEVTQLPVKRSGLIFLDQTLYIIKNCHASCVVTVNLMSDLRRQT